MHFDRNMAAAPSSDLVALLEERGISAELQWKLYEAKFLQMAQFAMIANDLEDMRRCCRDDLGIATTGLQGRGETSTLLDTWDAARRRVTVQRE